MGKIGTALTTLFAPDPHIQPIEDSDEIKKRYRYWRVRIFYSMFVGYAFYYFTRKSFTFAMPALIADLGYSKAQLGFLASVLSLSYGISKFVSGVMSDRSNPRYIMSIGLVLTGVLNILFGFSSTITWFAVLWGLNGWFQGFGWPPCARYLTHWYSQGERGRWWAAWNTSHNIGGALIPILATFVAATWGWRFAMYVPGVLCIAVGLFLINRLRDTPQSLGLPPIEKWRDDYPTAKAKSSVEKELSVKEILFVYVLNNPLVWLLAVANFFVYIVRIGINDWSVLFLVEHKSYDQVSAGLCVSWFEVGGFVGSLVAGWMSDKIFMGRRGPTNIIFSLGVLFSVILFYYVPPGFLALDSIAMLGLGFWIFGPQMLIGMAAAELAHKKAAATSSGFTGLFGYIGGAAAGLPLGWVAEYYGWSGFFVTLSVCGVVTTLLLIPLWSVTAYTASGSAKEKEKPVERSSEAMA